MLFDPPGDRDCNYRDLYKSSGIPPNLSRIAGFEMLGCSIRSRRVSHITGHVEVNMESLLYRNYFSCLRHLSFLLHIFLFFFFVRLARFDSGKYWQIRLVDACAYIHEYVNRVSKINKLEALVVVACTGIVNNETSHRARVETTKGLTWPYEDKLP